MPRTRAKSFGFMLLGLSLVAVSCRQDKISKGSLAQAWALVGMEEYEDGNMPAALHSWQQALQLFRRLPGQEREVAACHQNIGLALAKMGRREAAIRQQQQALRIYQQLLDTQREQAGCYQNLGGLLIQVGRLGEGIESLEQALRIYRTLPGIEREQADCNRALDIARETLRESRGAIPRQHAGVTT